MVSGWQFLFLRTGHCLVTFSFLAQPEHSARCPQGASATVHGAAMLVHGAAMHTTHSLVACCCC